MNNVRFGLSIGTSGCLPILSLAAYAAFSAPCFGQSNGSVAVTGPCLHGAAIPAASALLMPPAVPQPTAAGDIVGLILQNVSPTNIQANYITFGQVFEEGAVLPSDTLAADIPGVSGVNVLQLDALALWPDGSVKLGALTTSTYNLCAKTQVSAIIRKVLLTTAATPVNLRSMGVSLTAVLSFSNRSNISIDLGSAFQNALLSTPDYWLIGPLASQARVDVPVPEIPTLHITADITGYADGSMVADVSFNNDIASINPSTSSQPGGNSPLSPLQYTATVTLGKSSVSHTVSQTQYTDWHTTLLTNGPPPMLVPETGGVPYLNIQHDVSYLEHTGAILSYDLTTGVSNSVGAIPTIEAVISSASFGAPMSGNAITQYMPTTGGRPDIGFTTQYNTVWLVTQDVRAAAVGLAQSDGSGALPWNFKLANGHWLTPYDVPNIWIDGRGGPYSNTDGLLYLVDTSLYTTDTAHQPNLNYVPYLMTARRWNLDRLNAQAAYSISSSWPSVRCPAGSCKAAGSLNDVLVDFAGQVRGQAWSFRETKEAAFIGKPGAFDEAYYSRVVSDNWTFIQQMINALGTTQGEATGWVLPTYNGQIREWQEDYLTGVMVLAAEMGDRNALRFLNWQIPWLSGRFIANDFNPYDGCAYIIIGADQTTLIPYRSWRTIENWTVKAGVSWGTNGNGEFTSGDYCELARGVIGGALNLFPNNTKLLNALSWINNQWLKPGSNGYAADLKVLQTDPTFNIVPIK